MNANFVPVIPDHVPAELVEDWSFQTAAGLDRNPQATIDRLREGPPIVFSSAGRRGRSTWILKRYEHILEAMQDTELFSSRNYSGFSSLIGEDWPMIPSDVDAPLHRPFRMFLNKVFAPSRMTLLEEGIAETVQELIANLKRRTECDFQEEMGRPLPTSVFLRMMGLPLEDAGLFLKWENLLMHGIDLEDRALGVRSIKNYLVEMIHDREANPRDDILTYVAQGEIDDAPIALQDKIGMCFVLYAAGLDTVASALGFTFKYLAENPDRQEDLRTRPDVRHRAIEELMRANSMVVVGRFVTRDVNFHGVEMKKGDYVSLGTLFADRDPDKFGDPGHIDFDRQDVMRHITFGSGPHNCLGSHLARREMRIVLDAWLEQMPPFRIKEGEEAVTYGGAVFGVDSLPLQW